MNTQSTKISNFINKVKLRIHPAMKKTLMELSIKNLEIAILTGFLAYIVLKLGANRFDYADAHFKINYLHQFLVKVLYCIRITVGCVSLTATLYCISNSVSYFLKSLSFMKKNKELDLKKYRSLFNLTTEENSELINNFSDYKNFFIECIEKNENLNYQDLITVEKNIVYYEKKEAKDLETQEENQLKLNKFAKNHGMLLKEETKSLEEKETEISNTKFLYKEMI